MLLHSAAMHSYGAKWGVGSIAVIFQIQLFFLVTFMSKEKCRKCTFVIDERWKVSNLSDDKPHL